MTPGPARPPVRGAGPLAQGPPPPLTPPFNRRPPTAPLLALATTLTRRSMYWGPVHHLSKPLPALVMRFGIYLL